jgi:hypothetical protein
MGADSISDNAWDGDQRHYVPWPQAMMIRVFACACWIAISLMPATALEEPVIWRDPDTGCAYLLNPQGGIALRYLRDGSPDCPSARTGARLVDETTRGIARGLEILQQEVERLRERFDDPDRQKPPSDRDTR